GISVQMHASATAGSMGSMKSQFKRADSSGARFALIFGADELAQGSVAMKLLRGDEVGDAQAQLLKPLSNVSAWAHLLHNSAMA
ncbi:MAG: histidyl-tRNA synthetase, partial [Polaromonas sp.]|nr:histidyl-tRNA synthetase [Polaromonas sp.]